MRRIIHLLSLVLMITALAACHGGPHVTFVVSSTADLPDAALGDGLCEATVGSGDCTLRAAIGEANALTGTEVTVELSASSTYAITSMLPAITGEIVIDGNDATVAANIAGWTAVTFDVTTGSLRTEGLRVSGNESAYRSASNLEVIGGVIEENGGGGIHQLDGSVLVQSTRLFGNNAMNTSFSGIRQETGTLTVLDSELGQNLHPLGNGAIHQVDGSAQIVNTTIHDQSFTADIWVCHGFACYWLPWQFTQAGISQDAGSIEVIASTLSNNAPNIAAAGSVEIEGSVLSGRCTGPIVSGGFNVATSNGGSEQCIDGSDATDQVVTDAELGAPAENGGSTMTQLPAATSAAIDAIPVGTADLCDGTLGTDARGEPRPSGTACDAGAVERQPTDP